MLQDFLIREEKRRNRSLSKRFQTWLASDQGKAHRQKIERVLSQAGGEHKAVQLLKKSEDAYKADDAYKKQDNKRKKSLKTFQKAFESWLYGDEAPAYLEQIQMADSDEKRDMAQQDAEKAFLRTYPHYAPEGLKDTSKTRIRPVRHAFKRGVDDVMMSIIEPGLNQMGMVSSDIVRHWERIVGDALAKNTHPERIQFPMNERANATLYIKVRTGFNTIVQHHSAQIIFRINSHFGFKAVQDIRISKQLFASVQTTGHQLTERLLSSRVEPSASIPDYMNTMISKIEDDELKQAFEELGKVIKARNG